MCIRDSGTTIVKEYPFAYTGAEGEIPYYAILNEENQALYEKYRALTAGMEHFHLLGRLAEYRYYNIDAMVKRAIDVYKRQVLECPETAADVIEDAV